MRTRGIGLLACVLAVTACSRDTAETAIDQDVEDRTPYEQLENTADTSEAYGSAAPAPVTPVQGGATIGGPLTVTGQFRGAGQNPPPGSVTLTEEAGGTRVSILISDYTANAELRAAIVRGTCASPGAVAHAVQPSFRVGADGVGTLEAQVPVATAQLLDGQHAVTVSATGSASRLGCADLPAQH